MFEIPLFYRIEIPLFIPLIETPLFHWKIESVFFSFKPRNYVKII